jgi:hypothetical protein
MTVTKRRWWRVVSAIREDLVQAEEWFSSAFAHMNHQPAS